MVVEVEGGEGVRFGISIDILGFWVRILGSSRGY